MSSSISLAYRIAQTKRAREQRREEQQEQLKRLDLIEAINRIRTEIRHLDGQQVFPPLPRTIQELESHLEQLRCTKANVLHDRRCRVVENVPHSGGGSAAGESRPVAVASSTELEKLLEPWLEEPEEGQPDTVPRGEGNEEWLRSIREFIKREDICLTADLSERYAALLDTTDGADKRIREQEFWVRLKETGKKQRQARRLLEELPEPDGGEAESLRARLEQVVRGEADLTEALLVSAEQIRLENQMATVASVVESVLRDLGYEVGTLEHTLSAEGSVAYVHKQGWEPGYFVRMTLDHDHLDFKMVKTEGTPSSPQDDRQMENAWCSEVDKLRNVMEDRGVRSDIERRSGSEEEPIAVVGAEEVERSLGRQDGRRSGSVSRSRRGGRRPLFR